MKKFSRFMLFISLFMVNIINSSDAAPLSSSKIYTDCFKIKLERVYNSQAFRHEKLAQAREKLRLQKEIESSRAENEPWENVEFIDKHNSREQFKAGLERVYELKTRFAQELILANQRRAEDHEKLQRNKQMAVLSYNQGTGLGKALKLIYLQTQPKPFLTVPEVDFEILNKNMIAYDRAQHGQERFEVQKNMTDAESLYLTYSESLLVAIKEYRALSPYERTLSFTNDKTQQRLEITSKLSPWFTDDYRHAGPIMRAFISSMIHARLFDAHGKVIVNKEYGGTHQIGLNNQTQALFDLLGEKVPWKCQFCLDRKTTGLTDGVVELIPEFYESITQRDLEDK